MAVHYGRYRRLTGALERAYTAVQDATSEEEAVLFAICGAALGVWAQIPHHLDARFDRDSVADLVESAIQRLYRLGVPQRVLNIQADTVSSPMRLCLPVFS